MHVECTSEPMKEAEGYGYYRSNKTYKVFIKNLYWVLYLEKRKYKMKVKPAFSFQTQGDAFRTVQPLYSNMGGSIRFFKYELGFTMGISLRSNEE